MDYVRWWGSLCKMVSRKQEHKPPQLVSLTRIIALVIHSYVSHYNLTATNLAAASLSPLPKNLANHPLTVVLVPLCSTLIHLSWSEVFPKRKSDHKTLLWFLCPWSAFHVSTITLLEFLLNSYPSLFAIWSVCLEYSHPYVTDLSPTKSFHLLVQCPLDRATPSSPTSPPRARMGRDKSRHMITRDAAHACHASASSCLYIHSHCSPPNTVSYAEGANHPLLLGLPNTMAYYRES